jgi:hypothetical protein
MAYGINTTGFANALLNTVRGTSFAAPSIWIQLHVGDPGAAQTANLSLVTTRQQATFSAASNGALALASSPAPWLMTGTETLAAISVWSLASGGVPYWTAPLEATQAVNNGDTFTLITCGLSVGPLSV